MRFRLLGPTEEDDGRILVLGGRMQRAVLVSAASANPSDPALTTAAARMATLRMTIVPPFAR